MASLLVALYALCLLAPTAALAFSGNPAAAHCLTDDHHGVAATHEHEGGASHHHDGKGDDDHGQPGKCCGLFCLSALAPSADIVTVERAPASHLTSLLVENLAGRGSDRIDRPPRS